MSVVRVGATKQYSDNWDTIFSGGRRSSSTAEKKPSAKPARKSAKKTVQAVAKAGVKKRSTASKRKRK